MKLSTIENLKKNLDEKEYRKVVKSLDTIATIFNEVVNSNLQLKTKETILLNLTKSVDFQFNFSSYLTENKIYFVDSYIIGLKRNALKKIQSNEYIKK